jgi:hypothetical protein
MAKREPREYRARLTDDAGIIRGRIPVPLVKVSAGVRAIMSFSTRTAQAR